MKIMFLTPCTALIVILSTNFFVTAINAQSCK